jgi:hypothetical protein
MTTTVTARLLNPASFAASELDPTTQRLFRSTIDLVRGQGQGAAHGRGAHRRLCSSIATRRPPGRIGRLGIGARLSEVRGVTGSSPSRDVCPRRYPAGRPMVVIVLWRDLIAELHPLRERQRSSAAQRTSCSTTS